MLLLLEEFPVLKHMEKLEAAAGQLAGSGVKLWVIVQNLGQLKRHYKEGWETFIANAGVITAFGNADLETLEYLSKKLGKVAMRVERGSGASSSALLGGARLTQEDLREWSLLDTDEAEHQLAREKRRVLVLAAGRAPLLLRRTAYFDDPRFKGMFDDVMMDGRRGRGCLAREFDDAISAVRDGGRLPGGDVGTGGADRRDGIFPHPGNHMEARAPGRAPGVRRRARGGLGARPGPGYWRRCRTGACGRGRPPVHEIQHSGCDDRRSSKRRKPSEKPSSAGR